MLQTKQDGTVLFCNDARDGDKWHMIGMFENDTLVIWKSTDNIFQKYNSVGFVKELVAKVPFEKLHFCISDGRILKTSRDYFLAHCFTVQEVGWDEQLHLCLSDFGMDKVDEWEKSKKQQKEKSPLRQMMDEFKKQRRKR